MKKKAFIFLASMLLATKANCQTETDSSFQPGDSTAIEAAISNFYNTLSFSRLDENKYSNLPQLFTAQGVLISAAGDTPYVWTVQEYAQMAEDNFKKQKMEVWSEQETCSQTHSFGKIAQRFSTYKVLYVADGQETMLSGINAIQLVKENDKWLITSVEWDRASDVLPIPPVYNCH